MTDLPDSGVTVTERQDRWTGFCLATVQSDVIPLCS